MAKISQQGAGAIAAFAADLDGMTPKDIAREIREVAREIREARDLIEEYEPWLAAVRARQRQIVAD